MKIFFTIDDASVLLPDEPLRRLCGWHHWREQETDPHFCVAIPHDSNKADDVVDRLIALGCTVLPALQDSTTPVSDSFAAVSTANALAPATVDSEIPTVVEDDHMTLLSLDPAATTRDTATTMHQRSGFPPFRPTYH